MTKSYHQSVMVEEVLNFLIQKNDGVYVDATIGEGGHAEAILNATKPKGVLIGIDIDESSLEKAKKRLSLFGNRIILLQGKFSEIESLIREETEYQYVDGILMDLGLRKELVENPNRGFSFREDGPLDMRYDRKSPITAEMVLNRYDELKLAEIFREYGEIRNSRKLARTITRRRPLKTTFDIVRAAAETFHPAMLNEIIPRVFQAIRIEVNNELGELKKALPQSIQILTYGGRLVVITYHSLEERIVKNFFAQESKDCICPPESPECRCGHRKQVKILTRKPVRPSTEEIEKNKSARSARLRVAEKI